jgi:hypothetical protein
MERDTLVEELVRVEEEDDFIEARLLRVCEV